MQNTLWVKARPCKKGLDKTPKVWYNKFIKGKEMIVMKATGIIRRVDDLGRVVIPREVRKSLGIREGEPLEIYTDTLSGNPVVWFAKYEFNLSNSAKALQDLVESYLDYDHPHKQEILVRLAEVSKLLKDSEG